MTRDTFDTLDLKGQPITASMITGHEARLVKGEPYNPIRLYLEGTNDSPLIKDGTLRVFGVADLLDVR